MNGRAWQADPKIVRERESGCTHRTSKAISSTRKTRVEATGKLFFFPSSLLLPLSLSLVILHLSMFELLVNLWVAGKKLDKRGIWSARPMSDGLKEIVRKYAFPLSLCLIISLQIECWKKKEQWRLSKSDGRSSRWRFDGQEIKPKPKTKINKTDWKTFVDSNCCWRSPLINRRTQLEPSLDNLTSRGYQLIFIGPKSWPGPSIDC